MSRLFNGTSDYLSATVTTGVPMVAPFTVSAWLKTVTISSSYGGTAVGYGDTASNAQYWLLFGAKTTGVGTLERSDSSNETDATAGSLTTAGAWQHLAATSATGNSICYLNGVAGTADTANHTTTGLNTLTVGALQYGGSIIDEANARIGEVAIWNVALSGAQIASLAAGTNPTSILPGNLVAYYQIKGTTSPEPYYGSYGTVSLTVNGTTAEVGDDPPVTPPGAGGVHFVPTFLPNQLGPGAVGPTFFAARGAAALTPPAAIPLPIPPPAIVVGVQARQRAGVLRGGQIYAPGGLSYVWVSAPPLTPGAPLVPGAPLTPGGQKVAGNGVQTSHGAARYDRGGFYLLAAPIQAPAPQPTGQFEYQAIARTLTRRSVPLRARVASPIVTPLHFVPKGVQQSQAIARALQGRNVPKPHLAKPVVAISFIVSQPFVVLQARARTLIGRTVPRAHFAGPALPPFRPGLTIYQARQRALAGRSVSLHTRFASPSLALIPFPPAVVHSVAVSRTLTVRNAPRAHLAAPITTVFVAPAATIVLQARARALIGRSAPHPHLAGPALPPFRPGLAVLQARQRALIGRSIPLHTRFASPSLIPAGVGATVHYQAILRALTGRSIPLHVRVAAPSLIPSGPGITQRSQAVLRALQGRSVPKAHLATPIVTPFIASAPLIVNQARARALIGHGTPKPHLAPAVGTVPFIAPAAVVISQARQRSYAGRTVSRAHIASALTTVFAPGATVVDQARARALVGRGAPQYSVRWGTRPVPFPSANVHYEAVGRALVGRNVPRPHLAPAISTVPFLATASRVVSQALARPLVGRTLIRPHLASTSLAITGPPATIVSRVATTVTRHAIPHPHLATPVASSLFLAPGAHIASQAVARSGISRQVFRTHIAAPVYGAVPVQRGTFTLQAIQRAHLGRNVSVAHPIRALTPVFVAPAPLIVSQALRRAYTGRGAPNARRYTPLTSVFIAPAPLVVSQATRRVVPPLPHRLLPSLGTQPPLAPGTFIHQAVTRAPLLRSGRHLTAAPLVNPFFALPTAISVSQAGSRARIGRGAPAYLVHWGAFPRPFKPATVVSQAIARSAWRPLPNRTHLANPLVAISLPRALIVSQAHARPVRNPPRPYAPVPLVASAPIRTITISQALARDWRTRNARKTLVAAPVETSVIIVQAPTATALGSAPLPTIVGIPAVQPSGPPSPIAEMVRGGGRYPTFFAPYEPKMAWATVPPALPLGKILAIPPDVDYENWDEEDEEMLLLMM